MFEWFDDDSSLQNVLLMELDERTRDLYRDICQLEYGYRLLSFFDANPRTLLTAEDVAFHLDASKATLESDLAALAKVGLIRRIEAAGVTFFGNETGLAKGQLVREFLAWQARWHTRLARITRLIEGGPRQMNSIVDLQTLGNAGDLRLAAG